MPAAVEDYVVAYLGAVPGADHVQILGLPFSGFPSNRSRSDHGRSLPGGIGDSRPAGH